MPRTRKTRPQSRPYQQREALIVGIDSYLDAGFSALNCATRDAALVAKTLVASCGFQHEEITTIFNEDATLSNIRRLIETIGRRLTGPRSQLLFFFAGHGTTIPLFAGKELGFLVPYDGDFKNVYSTCFSMQDIVMLSEFLPTHHVLYILDCCFSGLVGVTTRRSYPEKMLKVPSRQIMTAGMSEEPAVEDLTIGHGLYTYWLCKALNEPSISGAPYLTAATLHSFLVRKLTEETGGCQTPQLRQLLEFGEGDNLFTEAPRSVPPQHIGSYSPQFRGLYVDADFFSCFSRYPPFNLSCVLPFRPCDLFIDDFELLKAEQHVRRNQDERNVVELLQAYERCGLLKWPDVQRLEGLWDFLGGEEIFLLMGDSYANGGMHKCALRWYGQAIRTLEAHGHFECFPENEAYSSVGYCLYKLECYEEAIFWAKSCIGFLSNAESAASLLLKYEGGENSNLTVVHHHDKIRFMLSSADDSRAEDKVEGLKEYLGHIFPRMQSTVVLGADPKLTGRPSVYPFQRQFSGQTNVVLKTILVYSLVNLALQLLERGERRYFVPKLLREALFLEPNAEFVRELLVQIEAD